MNIVFLNGPFRGLPYSRSSRSPAVTKSGTLYYPLWLAYAAGYAARSQPFNVDLIDAVARGWQIGDVTYYLRANPPAMIFCDTSTPSISEDLRTASSLKTAFPETSVFLVGTHATACAEDLLRNHPFLDGIVRGEYDQTCVDLAINRRDGGSREHIAGFSFRREGQIVHNHDRELLLDLDRLPWAGEIYRQYLNVNDYFFAAARFPMLMTITSRGCLHRCRWCLYPQVMHRGKYRMRSAENVAAEFAWVAEEMPEIKEIGIEDDLFTGDKNRLRNICERLIRQRNTLPFWCDTRVDLDYETMRLMKSAGCRLLIAGFESGSQSILDSINKKTHVDQGREFMANARRAGLLVHGCFVVGNPGETRETMQDTLRLAKQLNPDTVQFFPMIVYPGTQLYDWSREQGYLRTNDYEHWLTAEGLHNCTVDLPGLQGEEILRFCNHARRDYYLRRKYLFRKLGQSLTNYHEAKRNVKAFRTFARHLVKTS